MKKLGALFLKGVLIGVPMLVGITVFFWAFWQIENFFRNFILVFIPAEKYISGLGPLCGILFFCLLGFLFSHPKFDWLQYALEYPFKNIPILRSIYQTLTDLILYFSRQGAAEKKKVVIVPWPNSTSFALGLVTHEDWSSLPEPLKKKEKIPVFIPFSFQMGGITLFVDKDSLEETKLPFELALRGILTGWIMQDKDMPK